MKTKILLLIAVVVLFASGCSDIREQSAEELLKAPKMRSELYATIFTNHDYLSQLLIEMKENEMSKKMLMDNTPMLKMMCTTEKIDTMMQADEVMMKDMINLMVSRMESDTTTCSLMCSKVMESEHLKKYVMEHACQQNEKKMIKEKK